MNADKVFVISVSRIIYNSLIHVTAKDSWSTFLTISYDNDINCPVSKWTSITFLLNSV